MLTRRTFLYDLGAAVALVALSGCDTAGSAPGGGQPSSGGAGASTGASPGPTGQAVQWQRVPGGPGAAYVLVRDGAATIVDTGAALTEQAIGDGLSELGLDWQAVSDVVLTHHHNDHVGGLPGVIELATAATVSAGHGDLDAVLERLEAIAGPSEVTGVGSGDRIMDMEIIDTPGHTPGHISVFDPIGAVLVAGDAINGGDEMGGDAGSVAGPNPPFTDDMDQAWASAGVLADRRPDVILFGHGEPITEDAATKLEDLVADQ